MRCVRPEGCGRKQAIHPDTCAHPGLGLRFWKLGDTVWRLKFRVGIRGCWSVGCLVVGGLVFFLSWVPGYEFGFGGLKLCFIIQT